MLQVEKATAYGYRGALRIHLHHSPKLGLEESEHAVGNIRIDQQKGANQELHVGIPPDEPVDPAEQEPQLLEKVELTGLRRLTYLSCLLYARLVW